MGEFVALETKYFVMICLFIGMFVLIEAGRLLIKGHDDAAIKADRLRNLQFSTDIVATLSRLRLRHERSKWEKIPYFGNIPAKMQQAGMTVRPRLLLMTAGLVSATLFIIITKTIGVFPAILFSFIVGMVMPMAVINIVRRKRIEALMQQLPDALDLMRRGLSVGHPLNVTIQNVARNMPEPIAGEFVLMSHQIAYGDRLPDAVADMAERIDTEDMHYLASAVEIQHGSGGNLGEMLGTLSRVMRQRFAMRRRVMAVSSEGRISALILTAMPFLMYGGTVITAPNYYASVSDDPLFIPMCIGIAFFVIGNGLMLRKLINFRL